MVDIQSVTAEIRPGKKEESTGQKYNVHICSRKKRRNYRTKI